MTIVSNLIIILVTLGSVWGYTNSQIKTIVLTLILANVLATVYVFQYYVLTDTIRSRSDVDDSTNLSVLKTVCDYQDSEDDCFEKVQDKQGSLILNIGSLGVLMILILFFFAFVSLYFG